MPNLHLGKGLGALIGEKRNAKQEIAGFTEIEVNKIENNRNQPRKNFNEAKLKELASSIKEKGVIQPLVVRQLAAGNFELIAGERRLRAAKLLGLTKVPVVIRKASDEDSLELTLIENIQRDDLNAMEEARAYEKLMREFSLTQETMAQKVGKERSTVANFLRLLSLPKEIQDYIGLGEISMGHARALLALGNRKEQMDLCLRIISEELSVRGAEQLVAKILEGGAKKARRLKRDPHIADLEERLQKELGAQVVVRNRGKMGRIEIYYYSLDEFDRLMARLGIKKELR